MPPDTPEDYLRDLIHNNMFKTSGLIFVCTLLVLMDRLYIVGMPTIFAIDYFIWARQVRRKKK